MDGCFQKEHTDCKRTVEQEADFDMELSDKDQWKAFGVFLQEQDRSQSCRLAY